MYERLTENNCCYFRNNYLSQESYFEHRVSKGKIDSELADKPEINRVKNIINLNIMKGIKYIHILKWFYMCSFHVCLCVGGKCLSVVACMWRSVGTGEVRFPLPPWGFQGSDLVHHTWKQVLQLLGQILGARDLY